ncbi:hypothetical protein FHP29_08315 [Nocardioides albidus]|uniref:CHRD domain-containing protein n=1 Tax=Nocardioides albidus TaxID=1517589 RepID=A0A5C4W146_9ACTN|nr:hypothetical protein [Nocardioides albidus]TNM41964.1 hypothetical protein FHP29_08315 [Nocardioides albidus]
MRTTIVVGLALACPVLAAAGSAGSAGAAAQGSAPTGAYSADLAPVNHGGSGHVELDLLGTRLAVSLTASGIDDGVHVAHIHGIRQAQAECPALGRDVDGNGLVDLVEGLPDYGPVVRTLSNGTSDRGTDLQYERTFKLLDNGDAIASLGRLDQYAVVVHGVDIDGDGRATDPDVQHDGSDPDDNEVSMPALCGVISPD